MNQKSMMSELKWLTLESCVDKWSNEGYKITCSEALQFCSEGMLKVSCQLFNKLVRPVYSYSPLLDDGYYQRMAGKIIEKENKKSQEDLFQFSLVDGKELKNLRPDFNSDGYAEYFFKQREEYDLRLNSKAKEVFSRWKRRGMSNVSFEYGNNRMLDGRYQLVLDKELADYLTRMALGYDVLTIDSLCVVNDDEERFQLINEQNKPVAFRLSLGNLIIQADHRIEFENKCLQGDFTGASLELLRQETSTNDDLPTWKNLFINKKHSPAFLYYSERVDVFIEENKRLPKSHKELFDFMEKNSNNQLILPNGTLVSLDNFRNRWNTYTGKYDKESIEAI